VVPLRSSPKSHPGSSIVFTTTSCYAVDTKLSKIQSNAVYLSSSKCLGRSSLDGDHALGEIVGLYASIDRVCINRGISSDSIKPSNCSFTPTQPIPVPDRRFSRRTAGLSASWQLGLYRSSLRYPIRRQNSVESLT